MNTPPRFRSAAGRPRRAAAQAWGRFDDLRTGTAQVFGAPARTLVARTRDEVVDVVEQVAAATSAGEWAFGFLAYEAAGAFAPELETHPPMPGLPLAWFGVGEAPVSGATIDPTAGHAPATRGWRAAWSASRHRGAVESVRDHIAAGDTYQVNLTTSLVAPFEGDPLALYAWLACAQSGEHHAYLDMGRFVIAGASPELFFEADGSRIRMRPMKGTAPRGRDVEEDELLARALFASLKERAENLMILDLVRNDLGRIARPGSVRVGSLFRMERYPTVHQLTSEVTADLVDGVGLMGILRALFPCGSVTGAPKARSMQIIRALESGPRGAYCGAIGTVPPAGSGQPIRFAVAIRTALLDRTTRMCSYGAGGGITWDSDPAAEYAELLAKARILPGPRDGDLLTHRPGNDAIEMGPESWRTHAFCALAAPST